MVAVVLPDVADSYSYFLERRTCCTGGNKRNCEEGLTIWSGECSYITAVKWEDFKGNYNTYVEQAVERQRNIDNYKIVKNIK